MERLPRTLTNPSIRDTVTFVKTAAETAGEYVQVEVELAPGGGNGLHYHVDYKETFLVTQGELGVQVGRKKTMLAAGETIVVPVHVSHRFFNPSKYAVVNFVATIEPACQFEQMIRIAYGLANDGLSNAKGIPNIWYLALMIEKGGSYFPGIPHRFQKAFYTFMADVARKKGLDKHLFKYYLNT